MSTLFLVRHGQASFGADNYDQLSELGKRQGEVLGQHWAAIKQPFDQVYYGPRQRHEETMTAVANVYQDLGLHWPEPILLPELDEHQAFGLMEALPTLAQQDAEIKELVANITDIRELPHPIFFRLMRRVMRLWVRGEINIDGNEPWLDFKNRVQHSLHQIIAANPGGKNVVAFTSGGPVGVSAGAILNLTDEQTLDLAFAVDNATYTEILFSEDRFSLNSFNCGSHFQQAELITKI